MLILLPDAPPAAPRTAVILEGWQFRPTTPPTLQWVYQLASGHSVVVTVPDPAVDTVRETLPSWTTPDAAAPLRYLARHDPAALRALWPSGLRPNAVVQAVLAVNHLNPATWTGGTWRSPTTLPPEARQTLTQLGQGRAVRRWRPPVHSPSPLPRIAVWAAVGVIAAGAGLGVQRWRRRLVPRL